MIGHISCLSSNLVSQDRKVENIKTYAKQIDADIDQIFKGLKIPLTGLIRLDSGLSKGKSSFPKLEKVIMKCLDKIFDYVNKKDMDSFQNIYFRGVQQLYELSPDLLH